MPLLFVAWREAGAGLAASIIRVSASCPHSVLLALMHQSAAAWGAKQLFFLFARRDAHIKRRLARSLRRVTAPWSPRALTQVVCGR